ncbi:MAG TPA: ABC transporter ATP-binding protein [Nitrososphaerales archaeon]|nr:ABC transporter ATP-binding protein [Nitrososphaerales archaeon]
MFFPVRLSFAESLRGAKSQMVHAVDGVRFDVKRGEIFGLAGESGSGKTTVLRAVLMLIRPTSGSILYKGVDLVKLSGKELKKYRPKIQVVFQDPYESVNPRMNVFDIVSEGLFINNLVKSPDEATAMVTQALNDVQLIPAESFLYRYPHEISGGQRQRVAIARALVLNPDLILADEPVSMLDVSIRAEVMNVLLQVRKNRNISIMFVTHDLALSKDVCDRLAIMYLGVIVEMSAAGELVTKPYHPYTQALIAAVPVPDPAAEKVRVLAKGEIPSNVSPPSGCRYHTRCPLAKEVCAEKVPPLEEASSGHWVACHFWKDAFETYSKGGTSLLEQQP